MFMPDEKTRMAAFRFGERTHQQLAGLAERWHADKTGVVAHALELLADRDIAAVLGGQLMSAEQGLRCWEAAIAAASVDNDKMFGRPEWNLMADANNGMSPLLTMVGEDRRALRSTPTMIWANVADDIRLNGGDKKWKLKDPDGLVERLRNLDFVHGWAVVLAVQWFWEHANWKVNRQKDEWWTVDFRRQHECSAEEDEECDFQEGWDDAD
jgi:hypothetical protein